MAPTYMCACVSVCVFVSVSAIRSVLIFFGSKMLDGMGVSVCMCVRACVRACVFVCVSDWMQCVVHKVVGSASCSIPSRFSCDPCMSLNPRLTGPKHPNQGDENTHTQRHRVILCNHNSRPIVC